MITFIYMCVQIFNSEMHNISKITVISDTHWIIDDEITSVFNDSDIIVHAGDIMSTSIIKKLKTYCKRVIAVAGNNDLPERYSDKEDKKIISELKKVEQFSINNEIITVDNRDRFGHHPSHDD